LLTIASRTARADVGSGGGVTVAAEAAMTLNRPA
jgi:hypothetical protein